MKWLTLNPKVIVSLLLGSAFILITVFCGYAALSIIHQADQGLDSDTSKVKFVIESEIKKYGNALQGVRGALVSSHFQLDYKTFRQYSESRDLFAAFPAAVGFGFIRSVSEKELHRYSFNEDRLNHGFQIYPQIKTDQHMIVERIEPIEKSRAALGFDISFDERRREAALYSAMSGLPVLSKKISLVQIKGTPIGFLYLLPVYKTPRTPESQLERIKNTLGWAVAPIVLEKLIQEIIPQIPAGLSVHIQAGEDQIALFGDTTKRIPIFEKSKLFELPTGEQNWKIYISRSTEKISHALTSLFILYAIGILIVIFVGLLAFGSVRGRDKHILEERKWLEAVINSAGHAVIVTLPNGIISTFNPSAEKMLGYAATELINKHTPSVFHDPEEVLQRARVLTHELDRKIEPGIETFTAKALISGSDVNEWTYIKKDGGRIPVRLCVTAISDAESNTIGFLGIAEDLSEIKKMTSTIELQNAKMTNSSKMSLLGEMAGGIAHEINTPLSVIIGLVELIKDDIPEQQPNRTEAIARLLKVEITAYRIANIVKGLRLFSRNSENDPMTEVSIEDVVQATLDLCREKIIHASIELKIKTEVEVHILARPAEVSQVLMNLVSNAIDAVANLNDKWIELNCFVKSDRLYMHVTDSGGGIPAEIVVKMMNPFFTTKEVGKGTGLGLSISSGIIESHGGTLNYDSLCAHTRFVIELPVYKKIKQQIAA